jgi:hypothetical protein
MVRKNRLSIRLLVVSFFLLFILLQGCSGPEHPQEQASDPGMLDRLRPIRQLQGLDLVGKLPDGKLVCVGEAPADSVQVGQKKYNNALFLTDKSGDNRVKLADATNGKEIYTAALAGGWVVYAEATYGQEDDWEIKALNLDNQEALLLADCQIKLSDLPMPTWIAPYPGTCGSSSHLDNDGTGDKRVLRAVVRLYDLETRVSTIIDQSTDPLVNFGEYPQIDGNLAVYDQGRFDAKAQAYQGTVILLDLGSGNKTVLDHGLRCSGAVIRSPYVAWSASEQEIKLYNLEDKSTRLIVSGPGNRWRLSMNDRYLTWLQNGLRFPIPAAGRSGGPAF